MPTPPDYELKLAAKEVSYEMNSLRESFGLAVAQRLHRLDTATGLGPEERAFIESYAIHARNLIEFFAPRQKDRDLNRGIQARHFVDGTGTFGVPSDAAWLKTLDVRLSHLSPSRLAFQNQPGWDEPVDIYETLEAAWTQFNEALPSDMREWFTVAASIVDPQPAVDRDAGFSTSSVEIQSHTFDDP
jgi:hypothetical protein